MIQGFVCDETQLVFEGKRSRVLPANIQNVLHRKLLMLDAARELVDLRIPPGNRLEALEGDRAGQHSIRVNPQWRVCFVWTESGPDEVECVDYH